MRLIEQTYLVKAAVEKVWQALVDPEIIGAWGAGPAQMDDKVGTKFKLWGGEIWGRNIEVVPFKKLVQDWYEGDWQNPSKVTFKLAAKGGNTQVSLVHENVPDEEAAEIDDGWKRYFLGEIKKYLEGR